MDSEGTPFSIDKAVITSPTSRYSDLFAASDGKGDLRISDGAFWPECPLRPGDRIRTSGFIIKEQNGLYSYARATNIVILSHGNAPEPVEATAAEINAGKVRDRIVRTEGRVIDVFRDEIDPRFVFFVLVNGSDYLYAHLLSEDHSDDRGLFNLVDAVVRLTGLCMQRHRYLIGRQIEIGLQIVSRKAITVVTPPPSDPFSVPLFTGRIREVQQLPGSGTFRRKVRGTVLAVWGRDSALVRTECGALSTICFASAPLPACGEFIEAVGAPETDLYTLNLSRAIWRRANGEASPAPQAECLPISRLFTDKHGHATIIQALHGHVLRFTGKVRSLPAIGNERLVLEIDGHSLPVDFSATPGALEGVGIGCTIDVTGTCVMETENWRPQLPFPQIKGPFLVIRTPEDVRILSRPSWWTPGRLLAVIAILLVAFTITMIILFNRTGMIPDTLCTCVFACLGGECGAMAWIKTTKDRFREREWEQEDKKDQLKEDETHEP